MDHSREEWLEFTRRRARVSLGNGDAMGACASVLMDLGKHPETAPSEAIRALALACSHSLADAQSFVDWLR